MSATAALAPEGTLPGRRLIGQLWFWVLVAIAAGIVFGLVAPDTLRRPSGSPTPSSFFSANSIAVGIAPVVGIDRVMSDGRALANAIGNSVATMVIAKWQGERDDERFQAVLDQPSIVDREVQRALSGDAAAAEARAGDPADARFERDPATGAHVPVARDAER